VARPREFDTDDALDRAMGLFWSKGYEAASLDDLCEATKLNRSSLYAAFGDKRALFLETLDRYGDSAVARVTSALSQPLSLRKAIRNFLSEMIDQIISGPGKRGCFIGNCAAEVARQDRAAASRVKNNLDRVETAFREAFACAQARGELTPEANIVALARFFVASTQGLRLMGKANANRESLEDIAEVMVRTLEL
jgi:TetR/AcrR family transcriptional regulator, transcriptional repressor for nem operon